MNNQIIVPVTVIIVIIIVLMIIFLTRNKKDEKELEEQLNRDFPKKAPGDTDEGKGQRT